MHKTTMVMALSAMTALTSPALAMTFTEVALADGSGTAIKMIGDIERGDAKRFYDFVMAIKDPKHMQVIKLDSDGGYISESLEMAETIKLMKRPTAVPDNAVCASACFFLWASGIERYAASTAKIGVHRASGTPQADTSSIKMAEIYKSMRIPDSVIVKMITTASSDMTWLTQADYNAMSVTVIDPKVAAAPPAPPPAPSAPSTLVTTVFDKPPPPVLKPRQTTPPAPVPAPVTASAPVSAYEDGRRDRLALQRWSDSLTGNYKIGAEYWASVRNTDYAAFGCDVPRHPDGTNPDWINGCSAAKLKLAPMDRRRNAEPDYKSGWNAASAELDGGPPPCTYALPGQFCTPDRR